MKSLFLVRHAKSSQGGIALADRDRPLDDRGERDAARMGERMAQRKVKADLIMSSPALRALATAKVIAKALGHKGKSVVVNDRLYPCTADDLVHVIEALDDKLERVMLVGHNPGLTELAHRLSSEITHLPTCAIAEFRFDSKSWSGVGRAKPTQVVLDGPNESS